MGLNDTDVTFVLSLEEYEKLRLRFEILVDALRSLESNHGGLSDENYSVVKNALKGLTNE